MYKGDSKKGFRPQREVKEFEEEVVEIDRVTKVVKGGRRLRFRATVVIGNKKGKVGIGLGKSNEVTGAIQKAISQAKKDLITIKLDGTTIPHDIKLKYKAARIYLMPAAPGTGIIAGGSVRKVVELAGITDILSKCYGSTNKVNNTKATYKALSLLRETPIMVAKARNKQQAQNAAKAKAVAEAAAPKATPKAAPAPQKAAAPGQKPAAKAAVAEAPKVAPKNQSPKK